MCSDHRRATATAWNVHARRGPGQVAELRIERAQAARVKPYLRLSGFGPKSATSVMGEQLRHVDLHSWYEL